MTLNIYLYLETTNPKSTPSLSLQLRSCLSTQRNLLRIILERKKLADFDIRWDFPVSIYPSISCSLETNRGVEPRGGVGSECKYLHIRHRYAVGIAENNIRIVIRTLPWQGRIFKLIYPSLQDLTSYPSFQSHRPLRLFRSSLWLDLRVSGRLILQS